MVLKCDDIEGSLDVNEKINYSTIQKVENPQDIEEKRIELFYLKIQIKKTRVDCIVDLGSQKNLILETMVSNLGLETFNHPNPYPLGWVHHNASLQVTKQCKLKFAIYAYYIDEVMVDVVPLDICGVILGYPFMWDRDSIYYKRLNKLRLVKDENLFHVSAYKSSKKLPLVIDGHVKNLVNASKIFVLIMVKTKT